MSSSAPSSSSIQIPIRIHPQQPGMLRTDTGIQTGSNTFTSATINSQIENNNNQTHQTNAVIIPQISGQSGQYRINQPTPIINKGSPTFNVNLNAYDGVPIPPVLRPYQPPESKENLDENNTNAFDGIINQLNTNNLFVQKIYGCRQNKKMTSNIENEYLCSCADSPNIQYAKWITQSQIVTYSNGLQKIQEFNESNLQIDFLNITSSSNGYIQNNAMSPVEVICQNNEDYLFRFELNNIGIFCWDHGPFSDFYENLINDYQNRKKMQRNAPIITNGVKIILDSIHKQLGLIFCGEKSDIIEFLSVFTGKVVIITKDSVFNNWCNRFENKCLSYVGYKGDDFSRAIIRQFQITSHTTLLLLTYDSIVKDFQYLSEIEFDCLIADDGERLKNPNGRKRNALQSINCKYRIVLTTKLKEDELQSIQNFVKNDEVIYFNEKENTTKYIFVRPTDYQLALLASKPFEANKICQNGFLIHPNNYKSDFDESLNIYEKYSAKFLFLRKIAKNAKNKIVFIFKSKKLLQLCEKHLDSIKISYKSPDNKEVEALIALFFYNDDEINKYEIKIAIDCDYEESHYRLILYGTREHYFLSKDSISRNIQKVSITHVPSPPLITFDNNYPETSEFDLIVKSSASLVLSDVFDFQSLGISEFLEKEQIINAIHELNQNCFQFNNQPLLLSTAISLFRAIKPENVALYPISFFKLVKEVQVNDINSFLCDSKKNWLEPIKTLYQTIDFTPFHELKKYFFNSADKILKSIENKLIISNFFKLTDSSFKFELLPPSHFSNLENDKKIIISMQQGLMLPLNDEKRIEEIINVMKYLLILNDFHEYYIVPFWTENEVKYVANELADFGGNVPNHKLSILSKTNESIQNLKAEISRQLLNGFSTIKINSNFSLAQKVSITSIPQVVSIGKTDIFQLQIRTQLVKSLRTFIDQDSMNEKDTFLNYFIRSQKVEIGNEALISLFKGIVEFGSSSLNELLLSNDFHFRTLLTQNDVAYLEGKIAIIDHLKSEETRIPSCFLSETSFLRAVQAAIKDARNGEGSGEAKIPQRTPPTMPIVKQQQQQVQLSRNYSPPNELLQRAADLQNQKRFEKKKMKQMKPIISALPTKKQQNYPSQIVNGHFMQQLPLPVPQPQPILMTVKTVDDKVADDQQQQQPPQPQIQPPPQPQIQTQQPSWPRQPYFMPSVEIGRKVSDNQQQQQDTLVLPPKKRPINVTSNSTTNTPAANRSQQNDQTQIINQPVNAQSGGIVEPLKTAHVRMSQATARQMMNDEFLKSLPHSTRQQNQVINNNVQPPSPVQQQQQIGFPQPQVNELQTDVSLLPLKKKHLANSPPKK